MIKYIINSLDNVFDLLRIILKEKQNLSAYKFQKYHCWLKNNLNKLDVELLFYCLT